MLQRLIESDHAGRILYATPEAAQLLGSSRGQIVGQPLFRFFGENGRLLREHLRMVIHRRPVRPIQTTLAGENKSPVSVVIQAEPIDARTVRWRIVRRQER